MLIRNLASVSMSRCNLQAQAQVQRRLPPAGYGLQGVEAAVTSGHD